MAVAIEKPDEQINASDFRAFEAALGRRLPDFWHHELEAEEGAPASSANLFLVGESFRAFFDGLKPIDPGDARLRNMEVKRVWVDPEFLRSLKRNT